MEASSTIAFIWELLSEDVALWDGLHSPMLSWLGSLGILAFFLWHAVSLVINVSVVQRCYGRVWPTLKKLAVGRKTVGQEWQSIQAMAESDRQLGRPLPRPSRIDLDDVQTLDAAMRREPLLEQAWFHYRKTFVIERTAWFIEPRVFSTRAASEFFTQDILAARLNVPFYHQLPSLITGLGLLFTFLAILIGLSKLHADGSQIVGIQGLINGLAGKFLTSIIGLICANLFVLIEKSLFHRFTLTQQRFLTLLDELFPRKTMEQMLENFNPAGQSSITAVASPQPAVPADLPERLAAAVGDRLTGAISALTTTVQGLTVRGNGESPSAYEHLAEDMARAMKREMAAPIHELNQAIQELARSVAGLRNERGVVATVERRLDVTEPASGEEAEPCEPAMSGLRWFANWHERSPA
ncbi:MAG: hypothetical protein AB7G68_10490 [Nitrospiraceae bacterium]